MIIRAITKSKNDSGYKVYFENDKLLILECMDGQYAGWSRWAFSWGINGLYIQSGSIFGEPIINFPDLPPIIKSHLEYILEMSQDNS